LNCDAVIRDISNYLDGELELTRKHDLELHLTTCTECTLIIDQTKMTVELFCNEEPVELPQDVRSRLHEALLRKIKQKGD
jgi:anti-sigma factor RsiW